MYRHEYLVIYTQHFNLSNNLCWQHSSGKIPDAASIGQGEKTVMDLLPPEIVRKLRKARGKS